MHKILITLATVVVLALGVMGFAACGEKEAKITETYIGKHIVTETSTVNGQDGQPIEMTTKYTFTEQLQLLDDGTYKMVQFQDAGMATYVVYATGTYTKNAKNAKYDGYTEIVLENATYVQVNQDIYNHMFSLTIDTETSVFPHEIAGGATLTKEQVLTQYGTFGSRYIRHQATVSDTQAENWIDVESDVLVVE